MRQRPVKIGLTGSFGSGKSTAAAMFARHGAKIVDADAITRRLLEQDKKILKKVAKTFPGVILRPGEVDRSKLAKLVFQNPRELIKLTDILYPEALKEVKKQISAYKQAPLLILDVPLLFEAGWDRLSDLNIVVTASRQQQIARGQKRLGLSRADVLKRLKVQMPLSEKMALADIIIDNRGPLKQTRRQVDAIVDRLKKRQQ
jgi:dephospho-CoA kinase